MACRNVDRDNVITLRSFSAFLERGGLSGMPNKCGAGAHAKEIRGKSWVVQFLAMAVDRYPSYEEALRVVTLVVDSYRAFKGYRDFRVYCGSPANRVGIVHLAVCQCGGEGHLQGAGGR